MMKEDFSLPDINMRIILKKEVFFSPSLPTNTRSFGMYKTMKNYSICQCGLEFNFCAGVCSNDIAAVTGRHSRTVVKIHKELALECALTHCLLPQEV